MPQEKWPKLRNKTKLIEVEIISVHESSACVWISAIPSLLPRKNTDFFSGDAGRRNFPLRSLSYPGNLKQGIWDLSTLQFKNYLMIMVGYSWLKQLGLIVGLVWKTFFLSFQLHPMVTEPQWLKRTRISLAFWTPMPRPPERWLLGKKNWESWSWQ